jgi:uncharacterized protein YdhG (YjbR/CyaY superfamily)
MASPPTAEDYTAVLPADRREPVEALRRTIHAAAPDATESIAYAMSAFRTLDGQFLVSCAAFKKHYSLFPVSGAVIEALGGAITPDLAGKGTIQFPAGSPIPTALVSRIVAVRLAEIGARPPRSSVR